MAHALVALLPALLFLAALIVMDSFKLVRPAAVGAALFYGAVVALALGPFHVWLMGATGLDVRPFTRYVSPLTEEAGKALFIAYLLWRRRIGFLVDAAVQGFAVGTGFAVVENLAYLREMSAAPVALWIARGLGTAVLHGATTAIAAMIAKSIADRRPGLGPAAILPGLVVGAVVHSAYNHLLLPPLVATAVLLALLPLLVMTVFNRSEQATREWVGGGLDLDLELLGLVESDAFHVTRFGAYLRELRAHFDGPVVADMFCLLRLKLELAVQAKARLIAREAGLELPVDADLAATLAERDFLRGSIGQTGLLALKPLQVTSHRDDWHRHLLSQAGVRARIRQWLGSRRA